MSSTDIKAQCASCFDECVNLNVGGGTFESEMSWELYGPLQVVGVDAPLYSGIAPVTVDLCLASDCAYQFHMIDSFGDGWNGGAYTITDLATGEVAATNGLGAGLSNQVDVIALGVSYGCTDSTATNWDPSADCDDGSCVTCLAGETSVTVVMYDSLSDGWNGATYSILNELGIVAASGTLAAGGYGLDVLCLPTGCYSVTVGGGSWDSEVSWTITGGLGGPISGVAPSSGVELNLGGCLGGCNDPAACNYILTGTDSASCCYDGCVTIDMFDSANDGWNGAYYSISDENGIPLFSSTLLAGGVGSDVFCLPEGCYNLSVGGGSWDSEISWTISGVDGGSFSGGAPYADVFGINGGPDCQPALPIDVDPTTFSAEQLISEVFLGDCLEASNISFTGAAGSIGSFTNGASIGIEEGIILTSGSADAAEGPNNSGSSTLLNAGGGSTHLENLTGELTYDAAIFTFDFVASASEVTFTYVFASEEYPEFVCLFNDAFGFFVSGPGYTADTNIALVPGASDYVSIDNVNNNGVGCPPYYPEYYVDNIGGTACEYDGYTVPLHAVISTVPCETYQITIAVADIGDGLYDSAVFLKAQSFNAGIDMELAAVGGSGSQSTAADCEELGQFVFANQGEPFTEETTINFEISGTATAGVDYDALPTSITFQPGQTFATLDVAGILAGLSDVPESIMVTLTESCTCSAPPSIDLFLCLQIMLPVEWLDFTARLENEEKHVRCSWQTASEINNEFFDVERSADGIYWERIGELPSGGNPNFVQSYEFVDEKPLRGVGYYRIRQNDSNGEFDYSETRVVERIVTTLSIFPNPSEGVFRILGYSGQGVSIRDMRGREVDFNLSDQGEIILRDCSAGTYLVKISLTGTEDQKHFRLIIE